MNPGNPNKVERVIIAAGIVFIIALVILLGFGSLVPGIFGNAEGATLRNVDFSRGLEGLSLNRDRGCEMDVVQDGRNDVFRARRPAGAKRCELSDSDKGRAPLHTDLRYTWRLKVTANGQGDDNMIVTQYHHHQGPGKPGQWSRTGSWLLRHRMKGCNGSSPCFTLKHGYQVNHPKHQRKDAYPTLGAAPLGEWHTFKMEVRWTWRDSGYMRIWLNDVPVYSYAGPTYFDYGANTKGPFGKFGCYKERAICLVYVDDYHMETVRDKPEPKPEPLPVVDLRPGQQASCERDIITVTQGGNGTIVQCGKEE